MNNPLSPSSSNMTVADKIRYDFSAIARNYATATVGQQPCAKRQPSKKVNASHMGMNGHF